MNIIHINIPEYSRFNKTKAEILNTEIIQYFSEMM